MPKTQKPNLEGLNEKEQIQALLLYIEELGREYDFRLTHIGSDNIDEREIPKLKERLMQ